MDIRKRLEQTYGKGCFFARAKCAERIEKMGGIKTYKQYSDLLYLGKPNQTASARKHYAQPFQGIAQLALVLGSFLVGQNL